MVEIDKITKLYENLLIKIKNGSAIQINRAFNGMINLISETLISDTNHNLKVNKLLVKKLSKIESAFVIKYNSILSDYKETAIQLAIRKNLVTIQSFTKGMSVETKLIQSWLGRPNQTSLIGNLSARVWNVNKDFYKTLDYTLRSGLLEGSSANDIKGKLTKLLNNPKSIDLEELENLKELKRKGIIKNLDEKAFKKLEERILNYKPGRGVYKSAKKNAFRLARTEINRAYRQKDNEIRQNLPFIIGVEVKLSGSHPKPDICNDMAGRYPKDFIFTGWHPACICYQIPILASKEEAALMIAGKDIKVDYVKSIPKTAEIYIKDRSENINKMKSTPYFILENENYFKNILK
jgi:hypothetical protein